MLVVLVGFAFGQLFGYKGGVITIVGQGFSNTLSQYDDFAPGSLFDPDDLDPLSLHVDDFHVKWLTSGPEMGQPESFDANVTYRTSPTAAPRHHDLAVNHPLHADGTDVFLVGHGYAPVVTVRGGDGKVAYRGSGGVPPAGQHLRVVRRRQGARRRAASSSASRGCSCRRTASRCSAGRSRSSPTRSTRRCR